MCCGQWLGVIRPVSPLTLKWYTFVILEVTMVQLPLLNINQHAFTSFLPSSPSIHNFTILFCSHSHPTTTKTTAVNHPLFCQVKSCPWSLWCLVKYENFHHSSIFQPSPQPQRTLQTPFLSTQPQVLGHHSCILCLGQRCVFVLQLLKLLLTFFWSPSAFCGRHPCCLNTYHSFTLPNPVCVTNQNKTLWQSEIAKGP